MDKYFKFVTKTENRCQTLLLFLSIIHILDGHRVRILQANLKKKIIVIYFKIYYSS